jgi:hypothetical protein
MKDIVLEYWKFVKCEARNWDLMCVTQKRDFAASYTSYLLEDYRILRPHCGRYIPHKHAAKTNALGRQVRDMEFSS